MPKPRQVRPGTFTCSEHRCGRDLHTLTALASSAPSQSSSSSSALREAKGHSHGGPGTSRGGGSRGWHSPCAPHGPGSPRGPARRSRAPAGGRGGPAVTRGGQGTVRRLRGLLPRTAEHRGRRAPAVPARLGHCSLPEAAQPLQALTACPGRKFAQSPPRRRT